MSVTRYECGMTNAPTEYQSPTMHQDANGGYVSYDDYAALEAKCAALAAENAGLKKFITQECHVAHFEPETFYEEEITRYVNADGYEPETPATEAFLADVRASAFNDLCAEFVKHKILAGLDDSQKVTVFEATDALLHCAEQLAAQIRKGVQS
ncbi:hypothetical protein ABF62_11765 [Enterobacter hormaechei subsp. steigerwaltii]|uniref:hypothetical protein n=1 Tax=Enterobacter hormaechei TaxID=158836 RepID=UPI00064AEC93|nr:hypothetical protein [Enterobacter hormaechei]KLQ85170.1 hypothetical protein ABF62_11765 [Enterobacter hormaechei subsp. steigerwaltii]